MPFASKEAIKVLNDMISDYVSGNLASVVRCRDCEWFVVNELTRNYEIDKRRKPDFCSLRGRYEKDNYYCADGVRREKADT